MDKLNMIQVARDIEKKRQLKNYLIFSIGADKNTLTAAEKKAVKATIKELSININRLETALKNELEKEGN